MDNRTFIRHLSKTTGHDTVTTTSIADSLSEIITSGLAELDTIAIPGFGSFTAIKENEYIAVADDGSRTLMPPKISVTFKPGSRLSKDASPKQ